MLLSRWILLKKYNLGQIWLVFVCMVVILGGNRNILRFPHLKRRPYYEYGPLFIMKRAKVMFFFIILSYCTVVQSWWDCQQCAYSVRTIMVIKIHLPLQLVFKTVQADTCIFWRHVAWGMEQSRVAFLLLPPRFHCTVLWFSRTSLWTCPLYCIHQHFVAFSRQPVWR